MVTVWQVPLDAVELADPARLEALSTDEIERAARFEFAADATRWRASRLALREILAARVGVAAAALRFRTTAEGKVTLESHSEVAFSLSHAADRAVVAVGGPEPIGVDVEQRRTVPEMDAVIAAIFTSNEQAALAAMPDARQAEAFLRGWTRKEALAKAQGLGLPALGSFSVSLDASDARVLAVNGSATEARGWSVVDLDLGGPYVGALAARTPELSFRLSHWPDP